jgi:hypothetical protein
LDISWAGKVFPREEAMRKLVSLLLALGLAVAFTAPTFAAEPKTKAECEKAGKKWDDTTKKCS